MINACKGGSANKVTGQSSLFSPLFHYLTPTTPPLAVLPYFPYSRQSKKKAHRGAITARMLANLLGVAGVKHVITVDLHASQMQGFFRCPVDNLHAEPIIAKWIRRNVQNWREAVVVSKNAGGTKRVTSLADALKLNFGMVTTDRKRGGNNLAGSMILHHNIGNTYHRAVETSAHEGGVKKTINEERTPVGIPRTLIADSAGSPTRPVRAVANGSDPTTPIEVTTPTRRSPVSEEVHLTQSRQFEASPGPDGEFDDRRAREVIHGRLVQGHIVEEDFPSPSPVTSTAANSVHGEDDPMTMSHHSSMFMEGRGALGGSGDAANSSDDEDIELENPQVEHMITLVGDVKNRPVLIVDDMIDKPSSWIAAAEAVVKRGGAKKVYCIATHGVFGEDSLDQLQACECIDTIVVTNSFPIPEALARRCTKLRVLDLSFMLAEAIRRNHFGESLSPLFQHYGD